MLDHICYKINIQLDKQHIFGFSIVETLLYVMRLKHLGIEDKRIQEGLNS